MLAIVNNKQSKKFFSANSLSLKSQNSLSGPFSSIFTYKASLNIQEQLDHAQSQSY